MRFTRDGSEGLERTIAEACREIGAEIRRIVPDASFEALVLGGGYGRGEGGVLKTPEGDAPYNDLEFFLFIGGSPRRNERRYGRAIHSLAERMTERVGIDVEFKVLSLAKLRTSRPTMFYYDLVSGHRVIEGADDVLDSYAHHRDASRIPLHEAMRLLMNRCSGLLFAAERLESSSFTAADADFAIRNIAKAQLALGDVVLAATGQYHWSCLERHVRLKTLRSVEGLPMGKILQFHADGVSFKLKPVRSEALRDEVSELHRRVSGVAWAVWGWLEAKRLGIPAGSPVRYGRAGDKCPETGALKNAAIRLRTFGLKGVLSGLAFRYPREALVNTLAILLWAPDLARSNAEWLSRQLVKRVSDWNDAVRTYARLWAQFN